MTLVGEFVDELCPNLAAIVFTELIVLDDVDPGNEGVVEMPDAVCSQEQDFSVIFYTTKKHCTFRVSITGVLR